MLQGAWEGSGSPGEGAADQPIGCGRERQARNYLFIALVAHMQISCRAAGRRHPDYAAVPVIPLGAAVLINACGATLCQYSL
jgi:hypothetical protein